MTKVTPEDFRKEASLVKLLHHLPFNENTSAKATVDLWEIATFIRGREDQARIDSVQLYMDICEKEGVPPSWRNLREFQQGQKEAIAQLSLTTNNEKKEK